MANPDELFRYQHVYWEGKSAAVIQVANEKVEIHLISGGLKWVDPAELTVCEKCGKRPIMEDKHV